MNERITQLAVEAGLLNYVDLETPRRYFISGNADLEEVQKFAELIVRECANQLPRISEEYYTGDGIVEDSQKLILEHFGVEE